MKKFLAYLVPGSIMAIIAVITSCNAAKQFKEASFTVTMTLNEKATKLEYQAKESGEKKSDTYPGKAAEEGADVARCFKDGKEFADFMNSLHPEEVDPEPELPSVIVELKPSESPTKCP